jgi:hypothetical protein
MSVFTYRTGIQPSTVCMEVLTVLRTAYEGSERTVLMALRCAVRSLRGRRCSVVLHAKGFRPLVPYRGKI